MRKDRLPLQGRLHLLALDTRFYCGACGVCSPVWTRVCSPSHSHQVPGSHVPRLPGDLSPWASLSRSCRWSLSLCLGCHCPFLVKGRTWAGVVGGGGPPFPDTTGQAPVWLRWLTSGFWEGWGSHPSLLGGDEEPRRVWSVTWGWHGVPAGQGEDKPSSRRGPGRKPSGEVSGSSFSPARGGEAAQVGPLRPVPVQLSTRPAKSPCHRTVVCRAGVWPSCKHEPLSGVCGRLHITKLVSIVWPLVKICKKLPFKVLNKQTDKEGPHSPFDRPLFSGDKT